jgi:hypothetical protein
MLICVSQNDDFRAIEDKRDAGLRDQGHEFGCGAKPRLFAQIALWHDVILDEIGGAN